jgi:hypothetical protein
MKIFINYFLLILAILPLTGMYFPTTDEYLIILNIFALALFLRTKPSIDLFIILIILAFLLINIISGLFWGQLNYYTFMGFILRLTAPYLIIKFIGKDILRIFPRFALFMAIISIPFYFIQLFDYTILLRNFAYYEQFSTDLRYSVGKFSLFFHTIDIYGLERNSGFLWEPGGFGYFLGIAIMLSLIKSKFSFNSQILILIGVGLTTLSTTFYLFIIATIIFSIIYGHRIRSWIILFLPLFVYMTYYIVEQDFMLNKITTNYENASEIKSHQLGRNQDRLGRFGNFKVEIEEFIHFPTGFGINNNGRITTTEGETASGPCGLSHHIARWGIFGLFLLIIALNRFNYYLKKIFSEQINFYSSITIILFLFSNPIDRDTLLLALLYLPFISNNGLANIENSKANNSLGKVLFGRSIMKNRRFQKRDI